MIRTTTRHLCANRDHGCSTHHTSGNGRPTRKRCAYCGGTLVTLTGWHGVFAWRGDARYPLPDAVSLHRSEPDAQAVIDADSTGTLVVRWVES